MSESITYSMKKEMFRRGYSRNTIKSYLFCINKFLDKCCKHPRKITKKDIKGYLDYLAEKGMAGSTLNMHLSSIKFLFGEVLHRNIYINIRFSRKPKILPAVLTKEEVKRLIEAVHAPKGRLILKLMYSAGLRVNELVNIRVRDLELKNSYGWVRQGKGGKDRVFVIAKRVEKELKEHILKNNLDYNSWLFIGNNGNRINARTVQEIIKKAARKAGIKKNAHPHTLRHSFATHLIDNGSSLASVQALLGHSCLETTKMYIHMAPSRMINVKSPLDQI